ncbi:MAG: sodium dependent phosphate transporter [Acidimicrobiaceae bacterium]|nr:sodium dependent phosphate transporter [Acidimicrobiaceae bacterium]
MIVDIDRTKWEMPTLLRASFVFGLIYTFLVGVSSLESGIKVMGADTQESLFSSVSNPVAGLFIGILGTVLVQSSSASTSVIVGLVGTGALGVGDAVPMVMGANIGTTVTNTLVALAHMRQSDEFKRAFSAATVHDFFNLLAVSIILPIELATKILSNSAERISSQLVGSAGSEWKSPIKKWVKEPVGWLKDLGDALGASGNVLGTFLVAIGLVIILISLAFITKNMRKLVADRIEASLNKVLGTGAGTIAMLLGLVITISVQSSSITTSIMIPLAAAGVVSLRNIYPVTLGANVGTTITALLAALATSRPEALTVALVHTLFNVGGIVLLYPMPGVRDIPIRLAENLAKIAIQRRFMAVAYVVVAFIVIPLLGVAILR